MQVFATQRHRRCELKKQRTARSLFINPLSAAAFGLSGRGCIPGVVRPGVLRITSFKFFFHLGVDGVPESIQVAVDRNGSAGGRQKMQKKFDASAGVPGVGNNPVQLWEQHRMPTKVYKHGQRKGGVLLKMKQREINIKKNATSPGRTTRRKFLKTAGILGLGYLAGPLLSCNSSNSNGYDTVIRNGVVFDGTTAAPCTADIGIIGDKIVAIGNLTGTARKDIDARGCIVTPGFIDVHEHTDYNFIVSGVKDPEEVKKIPEWCGSYNDIYQGITTVVSGNCGFGYDDMNAYFAFLDAFRLGTNSAYLTPHGVLRLKLFGNNQPEVLSTAQLNLLKNKVAEEMEKGAIGLSSGLGYVPGSFAQSDELTEVAAVVKSYGGIYASHIRADPNALWGGGNDEMLAAVQEAIEVGRATGVRIHVSHIQCNYPAKSDDADKLLAAIELARRQGIDVTLDQYPYLAGGQNITVLVPSRYCTVTIGAGGRIGFFIRDEYKEPGAKREEMKAAVAETFNKGLSPSRIVVTYTNSSGKEYKKQTLSDIADGEGCTAPEMWARIACQSAPPATIMYTVDEQSMRTIMPQPYIFTGGDGGAIPPIPDSLHPRVFGTFPRKIREYVIKDPLMSLQDAIRSMTSLPAAKFQLQKRGTITEGNFADIAVIDLDTFRDRADFENPVEYAQGVVHLLVNGVLAIENRVATGNRGGVTLRRT